MASAGKKKAQQAPQQAHTSAATKGVAISGRDEEIAAIKELLATPELVLPHLLTGAKVVATK